MANEDVNSILAAAANARKGGGQPGMNFDPETLPNFKCGKCESIIFTQAYVLKKVSMLQSGTGREEILPGPVFVCGGCGEINSYI